jgi:hypothetical protein
MPDERDKALDAMSAFFGGQKFTDARQPGDPHERNYAELVNPPKVKGDRFQHDRISYKTLSCGRGLDKSCA